MENERYIDISLLKNKNEIAMKFADYFSIEELEQIDFYTITDFHRDLSESKSILYHIEFDNNILEIIKIYSLDSYPASIYFSIRIIIDGKIKIYYDCKYIDNFIYCLDVIRCTAINYLYYKSNNDKYIIKNNIYTNYSFILSKKLSANGLYELKFILNCLNLNNLSILMNYNFNIEGNNFLININNNIIKFDINGNYIYLHKNVIGITSLFIIIEKAIEQKMGRS